MSVETLNLCVRFYMCLLCIFLLMLISPVMKLFQIKSENYLQVTAVTGSISRCDVFHPNYIGSTVS